MAAATGRNYDDAKGGSEHPALAAHASGEIACTIIRPGDVYGPGSRPWVLIPLETISMFVRPFALTMRLAANMTGGHIAILAILSFVFIFTAMMGAAGGIGVGLFFAVPLSAAIYGLEIIVVLVQAYVFTLLSAVFIGMAIHVHH